MSSSDIQKPNKDNIEIARSGREGSRRSVRDHNLASYRGTIPEGGSSKRYRLAEVYDNLKRGRTGISLKDVKSQKTKRILEKMGMSYSQIKKFRRAAASHAEKLYKKEMAEYKKSLSEQKNTKSNEINKPKRLVGYEREEFQSPRSTYVSPKHSGDGGAESVLGIKPVEASVVGLNKKSDSGADKKFLGARKIEPLAKKGSPQGLTGRQGPAGPAGGLNSSFRPKKGLF